MNSQQLEQALARNAVTGESFRGVFAADRIVPLDPLPGHCVINTDKSTENGSHWIAVYQEKPGVVETFDSFGRDFSSYHVNYFEKHRIVKQSHQLQANTSTVCGQYCLFFLLRRCSGEKYANIVHLFTENKTSNDRMVTQYVNHFFSLDTPVQDTGFLMQHAKTVLEMK